MNIKNIGLVISHEYSVRVRKKSFIISTLLTPVVMGLLIGIPVLMTLWSGGDVSRVKVFDATGTMMPLLESNSRIEYIAAAEGETPQTAFDEIHSEEIYAVVTVSDFDESGEVTIDTFSKEPLNIEVKSGIKDAADKIVQSRKIAEYGIEGIDEILDRVKSDVRINTLTLSDDGSAREESVEIYMALAYLMSFLIYIFVFLFGTMVMRSVVDEKSSRVVEVLVSSVNSVDLMMGKIIGVALVALTQFALWIVLTLAIAGGITASAAPELMSAGSVMDAAQMGQQQNLPNDALDALGIIGTLSNIDWLYIGTCFVLYFLLGYLLYASMFAAVGAACDNETDTSQLQMPVTIPLIIGLFIMLHAFEHPGSDISFWASMIPWTSPMVMLARIPFGVVPVWELATSLGLLLMTFLGTAYLSAKIYKIGILMYGKKTGVKDLWKWIKQKE